MMITTEQLESYRSLCKEIDAQIRELDWAYANSAFGSDEAKRYDSQRDLLLMMVTHIESLQDEYASNVDHLRTEYNELEHGYDELRNKLAQVDAYIREREQLKHVKELISGYDRYSY